MHNKVIEKEALLFESRSFNIVLIKLIVSPFVDLFAINSLMIFLMPESLLSDDFL